MELRSSTRSGHPCRASHIVLEKCEVKLDLQRPCTAQNLEQVDPAPGVDYLDRGR